MPKTTSNRTAVGDYLEQRESFCARDIMHICQLSERDFQSLIDNGVVIAVSCEQSQTQYDRSAIMRIKRIRKLRDELDLDTHAALIVMGLLEHIKTLRRKTGP